MKTILSICAFLLCLTTIQAQKPETIVIQTSISCDHCIKCGSCGSKIYNAIKANPGVRNVNIQPEENTITVVYKPDKVSAEKIRESIAGVGYDADDVKATEAAYLQLDACCKKE